MKFSLKSRIVFVSQLLEMFASKRRGGDVSLESLSAELQSLGTSSAVAASLASSLLGGQERLTRGVAVGRASDLAGELLALSENPLRSDNLDRAISQNCSRPIEDEGHETFFNLVDAIEAVGRER